MTELLLAIWLEGGFRSLKRKKESRRKFLNRWVAGQVDIDMREVDISWPIGMDQAVGDKD